MRGLIGSWLLLMSAVCAWTGAAVPTGQEVTLRDAVECRGRDGLPNAFAKLKAGDEVRIAYLGGSITEQKGWRPKTLGWFRKEFPAARVVEINAAIGGTGSDLGVYRLQHDVLDHKPDLLFVEFAVNDSEAPPDRILKAMEGIVRQTWRANPATDICFVYDLLGPDCGQVSVTLDDRPPVVVPRFDSFSTYHRLATLPVGDGLPDAIHTITLRIAPDQPSKLQILHQRKENESIKELDPKIYNDTAWYAGAILLIGHLVE